ncbi:universal stress protein [Corynebacterium sp. CCM 8835]|uniref:Universal stress protein n=1 Tax=Corynebacterium antarcticum TaxID=2800405 RepID=A0ABS1FLN2_9CORY|nr:universal stress protein [Corynebacterium antarcticum]MCK7642704.1 universal stress protein [Corynebacterium antarcticum]MCK7660609.1 universal stress protein [Corynebacterium antarcticum]MCL0245354.1 universal stress protein [Corynebacterium antarcticum]MCX7492191.1 universal stress protein [Corynebacterium antarcticum]MCX7539923.1 universal stress protein [Corynebacterium antarcticum]
MPKNNAEPEDTSPPIRVLVAWRPDASGTEAVEFAAWLARTTTIQVRAVTAFTRPWPSSSLSRLGGKYRKWRKKEAAACESRVCKAFTAAGLPDSMWDKTVSVFADGPSETAILTQAADEFKADVVLLGSHGSAPKRRFMAGSTADALLHSSPRPLGLTPRAPKLSRHGVTRINCAFIDSENDRSFLVDAADLASRWGVPLRIVSFAPEGVADSPVKSTTDLESEILVEWREHTLAILDQARDAALDRHPEISVDTEIGSGWGWSGAVESVKWKKGDLLYLGSALMGSLERVFIGSSTNEILRHSRIPAIIQPAHGQ